MKIIKCLISFIVLVSCKNYVHNNDNVSIEHGNFLNEKRNGLWIGLYNTGDTAYVGFYKNGLMDSMWIKYYPNKNLLSVKYYKNGIKHGKSLIYNEDGNLNSECSYCNERLCGEFISYYSNGQINFRKYYNENHKSEGLFELFYESGKLKQTGKFANGKEIGYWYIFSESGDTIDVKEFK